MHLHSCHKKVWLGPFLLFCLPSALPGGYLHGNQSHPRGKSQVSRWEESSTCPRMRTLTRERKPKGTLKGLKEPWSWNCETGSPIRTSHLGTGGALNQAVQKCIAADASCIRVKHKQKTTAYYPAHVGVRTALGLKLFSFARFHCIQLWESPLRLPKNVFFEYQHPSSNTNIDAHPWQCQTSVFDLTLWPRLIV